MIGASWCFSLQRESPDMRSITPVKNRSFHAASLTTYSIQRAGFTCIRIPKKANGPTICEIAQSPDVSLVRLHSEYFAGPPEFGKLNVRL